MVNFLDRDGFLAFLYHFVSNSRRQIMSLTNDLIYQEEIPHQKPNSPEENYWESITASNENLVVDQSPFTDLSVRFLCNTQQKEKRETKEEPLQHANDHNNTRPTKRQDWTSFKKKKWKIRALNATRCSLEVKYQSRHAFWAPESCVRTILSNAWK